MIFVKQKSTIENPHYSKRYFQAKSIEEEALEIFMKKKRLKICGMFQLRTIILYSRGQNAWNELLQTEADVRKKRQKLIYDQKERQKFWLEAGAIALLIITLFGTVGFIIYLYMKSRGMA